KLNVLELFGAISGGMTSTPGLAAVEPMTDSDVPKIAYATIYPIAMVLLILVVQFII
ncbi:MAG TPA: transporter, partial [Marinilabiliales bacterium]|nr:transporter [Marinilabiliales bacterium]